MDKTINNLLNKTKEYTNATKAHGECISSLVTACINAERQTVTAQAATTTPPATETDLGNER